MFGNIVKDKYNPPLHMDSKNYTEILFGKDSGKDTSIFSLSIHPLLV